MLPSASRRSPRPTPPPSRPSRFARVWASSARRLLVFAFVALFVGAFVIFNTFNIVVTQRTRELGLLRALGASRGQVFTSVVIESLVIGLLGSAVGLAAGIGLAVLLKKGLEAIGLELPPTPLAIRPTTIIAAFVVGTS